MNINRETIMKVLAVAAVLYILFGRKDKEVKKAEKFNYYREGCGLGLEPCPPTGHIRMRELCPGGLGECFSMPSSSSHIRMREEKDKFLNLDGDFTKGHIKTLPVGNIMNSTFVGHHIRRDRRNNMLNSMMRRWC